MIDRLSNLALKIHNMRLKTERTDVDRSHIQSCQAKLARHLEQRTALAACLDRPLAQVQRGESYFNVHRHCKKHNDPKLNPANYQEKT